MELVNVGVLNLDAYHAVGSTDAMADFHGSCADSPCASVGTVRRVRPVPERRPRCSRPAGATAGTIPSAPRRLGVQELRGLLATPPFNPRDAPAPGSEDEITTLASFGTLEASVRDLPRHGQRASNGQFARHPSLIAFGGGGGRVRRKMPPAAADRRASRSPPASTPRHPPADLKVGDVLVLKGRRAAATSHLALYRARRTVYNFQIKGLHCHAVGREPDPRP